MREEEEVYLVEEAREEVHGEGSAGMTGGAGRGAPEACESPDRRGGKSPQGVARAVPGLVRGKCDHSWTPLASPIRCYDFVRTSFSLRTKSQHMGSFRDNLSSTISHALWSRRLEGERLCGAGMSTILASRRMSARSSLF